MPGTRFFFAICLIAALILVIGAPILSGSLTARDLSVEAQRGFNVWHGYDCAGCHTINGLGGSYAPDLTRIYSQRGDGYLRAFLVNPGAFHPNAIRTMPRFGLTITETDQLLAFLQAVDEQPSAFPPRPILISGGGVASADVTGETANAVPSDPVEAGHYWFSRAPANCSTCHSTEPDVVIVGPSLAGIATRAASRVAGQSAEQYIRSSILDPSGFIVPGFPDAMARNLGAALNGDQISQIIAFLMTLESN